MKRVTVPPFSPYSERPATLVLLLDEEYGRIPVTLEDGTRIGTIEKTHYSYSPPTHKGSRIARYHHRVETWAAMALDGRRHGGCYKISRRDALRWLLEQHDAS